MELEAEDGGGGSLRWQVDLLHEGQSFVRDLKTLYIVANAQVGIVGNI
jgi:hypothetical protein